MEMYNITPEALKVWSLTAVSLLLGDLSEMPTLGLTPHLLNQGPCGWDSAICVVTSSPGDYHTCCFLRMNTVEIWINKKTGYNYEREQGTIINSMAEKNWFNRYFWAGHVSLIWEAIRNRYLHFQKIRRLHPEQVKMRLLSSNHTEKTKSSLERTEQRTGERKNLCSWKYFFKFPNYKLKMKSDFVYCIIMFPAANGWVVEPHHQEGRGEILGWGERIFILKVLGFLNS